MPNGSEHPPDCGRRLLPAVIDQTARDDPDRAWCSLPLDDYELAKGFEDISYARLANAINKLAWFIESKIGKSTSFETFLYLGVSDIRYHMIQMAACKTGHKVLFSSHVNSKAVHLSLMEQTECTAIFSALGIHVQDLQASRPEMKHAVVPELDDLLDAEVAPHYAYEKTFEEAKYDPYVVLHTSGTTGDPKPIVWNHAILATQDSIRLLGDACGRKHMLELCQPGEGVRCIVTSSPFHATATGLSMVASIFGKAVLLPGFRHHGVSPSEICQLLEYSNATKGIFMPWMMEDVARRPNAERYISKFESVSFGGAVLSSFAAEKWAELTRIYNIWASTESLAIPMLEPDSKDYAYIYFDMTTENFEFRQIQGAGHTSEDGHAEELYELVMQLTEKAAPTSGWFARQAIHPSNTGRPYPEWNTHDLWTPHPDPAKAPYVWKFVCRADDLITFSTGVNAHPAPIERIINGNGKVAGAIVVGATHQQALALVELAEGLEVSQELAGGLWEECIAPANEAAPVHVRVAKTHVLLVPAGGFVRTPKGSVSRKGTEAKFRTAIDEVYEKFGDRWQEAKERYGSISQTKSITVEIENSWETEDAGSAP